MKKKIAVVLAALMMLSCSTVFMAAESPVAGVTVETEGVTVAETTVTTSEAEDAVAKLGVDANIVTVVELDGIVPKDGKVTLSVNGIKDGDSVRVFHNYNEQWVERPASVVNGKVVVDFTGAIHFSPVIITKVENNSNNGVWWPTSDSPTNIPTNETLPKTGAPVVLPFAALACVAGAVVCGRKAK